MIVGSGKLSKLGLETSEIRQLLQRRRLQILVHSYVYYESNKNLVSDQVYDSWCKELVQLQEDYPKISKSVDYYKEFKDFDGSSGYDLPYNYPEIVEKAQLFLYNQTPISYIGNVAKNNKNPRRYRNMAKAKWLEEGTQLDLLNIIQEALESGEKKDITKAGKAVEELIERVPAEGEGADVAELINSVIPVLETAAANYADEIAAVGDIDEDEEDTEETDEEGSDLDEMTLKELRAVAKELGIKTKGLKKDELIESILEAQDEDDEDDEEDEEEVDYTEMTVKELKAEAKDRGIRVKKGMKRSELVKALEADDEE